MPVRWQRPIRSATGACVFSTTLPISVEKSHKQAVRKWAGRLRARFPGEQWRNRNACAGVSRHEVLRVVDVEWCHEIRPCKDIGRPAARRNASAAERNAGPGIAAPCSAKRAHTTSAHACGLPRRTPPASCVWRTSRRSCRFTLHCPTAQPPALPSHKARLGLGSVSSRTRRGCSPGSRAGP
jgi:hypothetical protein